MLTTEKPVFRKQKCKAPCKAPEKQTRTQTVKRLPPLVPRVKMRP